MRNALRQRRREGCQIAGGLDVEGATSERLHQLGDVLPAVGRPLPIDRELGDRHAHLIGNEGEHWRRRNLVHIDDAAGETHTAQQHGEPKPHGSGPPLGHQLDVGRAQRVVPDDLALIGGPGPKRSHLLVGEKPPPGHGLSFLAMVRL